MPLKSFNVLSDMRDNALEAQNRGNTNSHLPGKKKGGGGEKEAVTIVTEACTVKHILMQQRILEWLEPRVQG